MVNVVDSDEELEEQRMVDRLGSDSDSEDAEMDEIEDSSD